MKMKQPIISKAEFAEMIKAIQTQQEKDARFGKFMKSYLDGDFKPIVTKDITDALIKSLSIMFDDKSDESWMDWFVYENSYGKEKLIGYIHEKEYVITNSEDMYDFMVMLMNFDNKKGVQLNIF